MPGNLEAWTLWKHANTQWRAGGFGVVGLDLPAVRDVARILGLDFSAGMLRKIQALERFELERINKSDEAGSDRQGDQNDHSGR